MLLTDSWVYSQTRLQQPPDQGHRVSRRLCPLPTGLTSSRCFLATLRPPSNLTFFLFECRHLHALLRIIRVSTDSCSLMRTFLPCHLALFSFHHSLLCKIISTRSSFWHLLTLVTVSPAHSPASRSALQWGPCRIGLVAGSRGQHALSPRHMFMERMNVRMNRCRGGQRVLSPH